MALDDSIGRLRAPVVASTTPRNIGFVNPYPWMSGIEARVQLALEAHNTPFCWRYFDGVSPTFAAAFGANGYQPEFTLLELKTVIIVQGAFWGALDEVLNTVALAQAALSYDGWNVVVLWEGDIRTVGPWELLVQKVPGIESIKGVQRNNPFATAAVKAGMARNRSGLRSKLTSINGGTRDNVRRIRSGAYAFNSTTGRSRLGRKGVVSGNRARYR